MGMYIRVVEMVFRFGLDLFLFTYIETDPPFTGLEQGGQVDREVLPGNDISKYGFRQPRTSGHLGRYKGVRS